MKDFATFRYCTVAARLFSLALAAVWSVTAVAATTLDQIEYSTLPGDRVQVRLQLSESIQEPLSFAIDNPARVALDFPNVGLNLSERTQTIGVGMARSITAVEAGGRTRVVLNLIKLVPYTLRVQGNNVLITVESAGVASAKALEPQALSKPGAIETGHGSLENVDFRRGEAGEGRVLVSLSDSSVVIDSHQEGSQIIVDFLGASLPERLSRRLDVVDFATPVTMVDTFAQGNDVRMILETSGGFDHLAYQSDNLFTLDVKPLSKEEAEASKKQKFGYSGEKLSLNFQNIEVRAVLQLIADFTGLNLVASDTVSGSLTLRLKNVPWDQAMDIILKTKGLAMRQTGNVILVAPSEEIAAREKLELEANKQITELAPLQTEFVQINYAKAADIAKLLKAEENSLMSERGNVTIDDRTNTLLVRDTATNISNIRRVVANLDIPVRQVLIESRIVLANNDFSKDLGVQWGFSRTDTLDNEDHFISFGGDLPGDTQFGDPAVGTFKTIDDNETFMVDLGIADRAGSFGLILGQVGSWLLQLELQAMEADGRGEVLANPRVVTANQKEAVIEQGTEIPYAEASSSGATTITFKPAVLQLKVTPQITPDNRVIMDLAVSQDSVGTVFAGIPSIDTRAVSTQVLVADGDTVVLGGIYEQTFREDSEKVPFFGDLPYVGWAFKSESRTNDRRELLVFVTPKILKEGMSLR